MFIIFLQWKFSDEQNQIIINDLKATIIALRGRLEDADFEKKKVEQEAIFK